jgi:NADPH:quinone reductase-like Zn-dependent oxidoreductase
MPEQRTITTLEVSKDDWSRTRLVAESFDGELAENEVLLQVDRQALTANNISYASAGDSLGYWKFFPAEEGWGRIPAMGWADVVASRHPDVAVGERVWGFYPFASHLKIVAGKIKPGSFSDVSSHREGLAPVYAQFDRAAANPIYEPAREDQDSLLRGLFMTSWLVEDFLQVNQFFDAGSCLITSASSKTSIALGHCVKQLGQLLSVAVTSAANAAFCESLGCYDRVVTYDQATRLLDAGEAVVMVDMAGSAAVLSDLHHHYGDNMKYSCRIGATHLEGFAPVEGLPGATPEFFFAPAHLQARSRELGSEAFAMSLGAAYVGFRQYCDSWMTVEQATGHAAVEQAYQKVLAGRADPAVGQIISIAGEG